MSPNRIARIRAMAKSYLESVKRKHYMGIEYLNDHYDLQNSLNFLSDEEMQLFYDEFERLDDATQ